MKTKTISKVLSAALVGSMLVASSASMAAADENVINLYAFTDEVPGMLENYIAAHPDFGYTLNTTIIATTNGEYQPALDQALAAGGESAPDIYVCEDAFVAKYTKGAASGYAAAYEDLGIDMSQLESSDIAAYSIDAGTNPEGKVVGLGYQATGGAFIYRRSIAQEVFGSDDRETVEAAIGAGSGNWDKFFEAAETLKGAGYAIISGDGDIWHPIQKSAETGWIVDGMLHIDPAMEGFLDISKTIKENGYSNDTTDWTEAWYGDMADTGEKKVFGWFGPAWLINYVMAGNAGDTYGDYAVCTSPVGFFWGGSYLLANKDTTKAEAVAELINWVTLDASEDGLQYKWANGTMVEGEQGTKDCVASGTVMNISNGELDFLGGQNMFDVFVPANAYASAKNISEFDETINSYWRDQVREYAAGNKDKDAAIADFKQQVADNLGIDAE